MAKKKIFGIFTKDKKVLLHYLVLTLALFGGFYLGESILNLSELNIGLMIVFWFAVIYISDQLIHHFMDLK